MKIESLKKRSSFLKLNNSQHKISTKSLVLQMRQSDVATEGIIRVGYTTSKKLGNAVVRNRIKRRLKAAARAVMPELSQSRSDYAIIGRKAALDRDFNDILKDLKYALHQVKNPKNG